MEERKASHFYDYIILGSGIAGLYTALLAREHGTVLVITKSAIEDSNTRNAQGGIAAPIGEDDSPALYFKDTMEAGAGLCNSEVVRILVNEAADRITDLIELGVQFDTTDGKIALGREAAHTVSRVLHAGGDATGQYVEAALVERVREAGIRVLERTLATEILVNQGKLQGIRFLESSNGLTQEYSCRYLILATGGAGQLFKHTTNPDVATGDGIALAFRCGVHVADMEFFQFHPTALRLPGVPTFLISEIARGEGGILRNINSYAFMHDYSPEAELAPRDIVSRSVLYEMKKTGSDHVFLDVTHLSSSLIKERLPSIFQFCLSHGLDITRELIPVAAAAHYYMGGIKTNTWGETNIPGILAAGEVACTGVHGANRLASNSLMAALVFGKRAIERTRQVGNRTPAPAMLDYETSVLTDRKASDNVPPLSLPNLQSIMWDKVGIIRSGECLSETAGVLAAWQSTLPVPVSRASFELNSLVLIARLMTEAAWLREESRGAHFRTDFPRTSETWERHIVFGR